MKRLLMISCFIIVCVFFNSTEAQKRRIHSKKTATKEKLGKKIIKYGMASFYAAKFHGRKTANGEVFKHERYTAACNALPLNTWIKVTNLKNAKTIVVKINDRLHPKTKRLVDLSKSAAEELGYVSRGVAKVKVEVLNNYKPQIESF